MPAAAAGVPLTELREPPFAERTNGFCHGAGLAAVIDLDPHLLKPHEGPHAHAAGNEDLNAVLRQVIDRSHAAALLMRDIGQGADFQHLAFGYFHQGVKVTVAEMGPQRSLESPWMI